MENKFHRLYDIDIPIIAITGGIASGKTTFSNLLRQKKFLVIDADIMVKNIYSQKESVDFIKKISPGSVNGNKIDFKTLRKWFFQNQENQNLVENFIYQKLENEFLKERLQDQQAPFIFYDIPLLFEKELQSKVDLVVCVYIGKEEQLHRLIKRDNISHSLATTMISKQINIEYKVKKSNIIINNSKGQEYLEAQIESLIKNCYSLT